MARKAGRLNHNQPSAINQQVAATAKRGKWKQRLAIAAGSVVVIALCVIIRSMMGGSSANAQIPNPFRTQPAQNDAAKGQGGVQQAAATGTSTTPNTAGPAGKTQHDVMAVVNGQDIRRDQLAAGCAERFGEEVLEGLVNKRLIMHHCRNHQIDVTDPEIDAEIDRMSARFKVGRQQWLEMLQRERNINLAQYKRDILWPTLALRKLAAKDLTVDEQQLQKAYEAQYGPSVQCRLIVVNDRALADQIQRQVAQRPEDFARLAMKHSQDVNSASIGGLIQPIRMHVGDPAIEKAVFALQPKGVTPVIPIGEQFAVLECESINPPRKVPPASVRAELTEQIKEEKLRDVASQLFEKLQKSATIQNIWNDPQARAANPGIVAKVNAETVSYKELAEECMLRYGQEVLDIEISHLLLQQALAKANIKVEQTDLDAEIAHAAKLAGVVDKQGRPDVQQWMKTMLEDQRISQATYIRDAVWPSAALKKLTGSEIKITKVDLEKGYEANYGERVRCRAVVLPTMRAAQDVWEKARQNTSMDFFGELAAEYSVESQSKALRGEVPPIGRHGGQPQLEQVAFALQPGELSGVIQMGTQFVILKCEGRTAPVEIKLQEVQDILYQDIFEKKLRMAMSDKFDDIRSNARIDNYLAGTSQSPDRVKGDQATNPRVDSAVRPAVGMPQR